MIFIMDMLLTYKQVLLIYKLILKKFVTKTPKRGLQYKKLLKLNIFCPKNNGEDYSKNE